MISTDLHIHTHHSHARNSVAEMYAAAMQKGLSIIGFTEHSPRPPGYDYPSEYRERLNAGLPLYVEEVAEAARTPGPEVLFGMEMDWIGDEEGFVRAASRAYDFDYLLGSVHFLGTWGFDATSRDWEGLDEVERGRHYETYFAAITAMAESGLFQIAAHLDIIKIFSVESFRLWLPEHLDLVRDAIVSIRDNGMALEISSAGLRKPCAEIYPGPVVMELASDLGVPIAFASDAHAVDQLAFAFPELAAYAASYGYSTSLVYKRGERRVLSSDASECRLVLSQTCLCPRCFVTENFASVMNWIRSAVDFCRVLASSDYWNSPFESHSLVKCYVPCSDVQIQSFAQIRAAQPPRLPPLSSSVTLEDSRTAEVGRGFTRIREGASGELHVVYEPHRICTLCVLAHAEACNHFTSPHFYLFPSSRALSF